MVLVGEDEAYGTVEDDESSDEENEDKNYDMKSREARYSHFSEEFAYQNSRKKEISAMDHKQRHLLLFTNFDQLNFININKSNIVKAWALLYHFRNVEVSTNLGQEFHSIAQRNCVNKKNGHQLFGKLLQ